MATLLIVFIPAILILIIISCLGIFISRKSNKIKKITSQSQTNGFFGILAIGAFYVSFNNGEGFFSAIGFVIGFVYLLPIPCALVAVLLMNKFSFNKKEYWNGQFSNLIIIFIILLNMIFKLW